MTQKKVTIKHKHGLHMRPSGIIVDEANKFKSNINIYKGEGVADAKSILAVTMLAVTQGEEIIVEADGKDENEAIQAVVEIIESNFEYLLER